MNLRLVYRPEHVKRPILAEIVLRKKVRLNILDAKVNSQKGELIVSVPLEGEQLEDLIKTFQAEGVTVEALPRIVDIDRERCTSCGACISPCPVSALSFGPGYALLLDENRCVGCRVCVDACPVRAIKMA
jgi:NAD-dependent dihydropyrimidine dehydrogenase PreA subunit